MPKRLSEYTLRDYLHLRPLTQGMKTRRYRRMDAKYMKLPAASANATEISRAIAGRKVMATVAFEDPVGLEMHLALVKRYVAHDVYVVIENSRNEPDRRRNAEVAARAGVWYLELPQNPWTGRNDSRSHGIGLNWAWHNVIRPGAPEAFGFVDDDLFAVRPVDPFAPLAGHDFYGDLRWAGRRWFLWAGYCFFRFGAVKDRPLDFGLDWFNGLDTGGANWDVLYRFVDPASLPHRPIERTPAVEGQPLDAANFEKRGEWIHEVGWGNDPAFLGAKRSAMIRLLQPHLPPELAVRLIASDAGAANLQDAPRALG
jgi:hypothetical protein